MSATDVVKLVSQSVALIISAKSYNKTNTEINKMSWTVVSYLVY